MIEVLCAGLIVGCISQWLLVIATKWGIVDWLQIHAINDTMYKLASCYFCMSWWLSLILCGLYALYAHDVAYLLSAVVATIVSYRDL